MPCPARTGKFSLCESHHQSQTSYCRLHHSELQTSRNLRVLHWGCRVGGIILSHHILWWLPKSSDLCATWHCHDEARFLLDSGQAELIWNASWVQSVSCCKQWSWMSPISATQSQQSHLHSASRQWSWPHPATETLQFFPWEKEEGAIPCIAFLTPVQLQNMPITWNKLLFSQILFDCEALRNQSITFTFFLTLQHSMLN